VTTNVDRVREMVSLAGEMNIDELITYFADGAVMELPYAPGNMPRQYEGKDAAFEFQRFARDSFSSFSMTLDAVYETTDPNIVVAETHSDGIVVENGRRYQNRYVFIFTFDPAGKVVNWREYYDPGVVVRAFRP
jgi:ketosteroid isomerase-like protein